MKYSVRQLIDKLNEIENKKLPVVLDGCDCCGYWNGSIEVNKRGKEFSFNNTVILGRDQ